MAESAKRKPFRILPDDEFWKLTTEERVAYLKEAMEVRNDINRQIDAGITHLLPTKRSGDG
jgi:hypothetical protein